MRRAGLAAVLALQVAAGKAQAAQYDLVVRAGRILDGTGSPWFQADIGIANGRIVAIGDIPAAQGKSVADAAGLAVAPGFIDVHSHVDLNIDADSTVPNYLLQGVTTAIGGNCGDSPYPLRAFFARIEKSGLGINLAVLVGHNTIRKQVMGEDDRAPDAADFARMEALVQQEMDAGGIGFSTGLAYVPGRYSTTEEIIRLAKVVRPYRGIYATHLRNQAGQIREAIEEAIRVGREAGVRVQLSHIKLADEGLWGRRELITEPVEAARREGLEVYTDQHPYIATSSRFASSFPGWAVAGGPAAFAERMKDPAQRRQARESFIERRLTSARGLDPLGRIYIAESRTHREYQGKTLRGILELLGRDATAENAAELIIEMEVIDQPQGVYFQMDEQDVGALMTTPWNMIGSDGEVAVVGQGSPHPRFYGSFPRVLGEYSRRRGVLTMADAVRRMTALPAQAMGLYDRGLVRPGMVADIVVFDPDSIQDRATFEQPHQYPQGVRYVIINGQIAARDGQVVRPGCGRPLRGPGWK